MLHEYQLKGRIVQTSFGIQL